MCVYVCVFACVCAIGCDGHKRNSLMVFREVRNGHGFKKKKLELVQAPEGTYTEHMRYHSRTYGCFLVSAPPRSSELVG